MIVKVVGVQLGICLWVLDVMVGLGWDGFVFVSLGCEVILVECQLLIVVLFEDGLECVWCDFDVVLIVVWMCLFGGNLVDLMCVWDGEVLQVIYFDLMFFYCDKSVLVKKEMCLFWLLVGDDFDVLVLLQVVLVLVSYWVVVKCLCKVLIIEGFKFGYSLEGKFSCYDIYLKKVLGKG